MGGKSRLPRDVVSGGETQAEIDKNMKQIMKDFPKSFSDSTGKVKGPPIKKCTLNLGH